MRNDFIHKEPTLSPNIYQKEGFEALFKLINKLIEVLALTSQTSSQNNS